jgi:hypothetical protein
MDMNQAPGQMVVLAFLVLGHAVFVMRERGSTLLIARILQTEFLLALDLDHLRVMHRDLNCAKAQVTQRALNFTQNACFVLAVNAT